MLMHYLKGLAILAMAAALVLLPVGAANAKGGGGGRGGGGGGRGGGSGGMVIGGGASLGSAHSGFGSSGNFINHEGHGRSGNFHDRGGFGYGYDDFGFFGFGPDYWPSYGVDYYGDYPNYAPYYSYEPDYVVPPASVAPRPVLDPNVVYLGIRLPDANAEVWINGVKTQQKGMMRPFVSPTLMPGKEYTYEIKAQWQQGGQTYNETRQLTVRPGEQYGLNFTASAPIQPK